MIRLTYANTNTYLIPGSCGGLLVDTGYAGTLRGLFRALKANGIAPGDIEYVMATHYHPDHMGLIGELMRLGIGLLLIDVQRDFVHFSDRIFARDGLEYVPIDASQATTIRCADSRAFLGRLGLSGEILHTPSHSPDSVCVALDDGTCIVGDLEPMEYLAAYGDAPALRRDWDAILHRHPGRILYGHINEKRL